MAEPLNWDEFRIVRAIAEAQSLTRAAERLRLNHSTLFRRLAAMETRLGHKLFERERSGYRPTAAGEDMVALANLMGDTIAEFERRVTRSEVQISGRVRLTTVGSVGALVLPAITAALAHAHPALHLEILLSDALADMTHGGADIALRCSQAAAAAVAVEPMRGALALATLRRAAMDRLGRPPAPRRALGRALRTVRSAGGAALDRSPCRALAAGGDGEQRPR